jgi:hypothetical protein
MFRICERIFGIETCGLRLSYHQIQLLLGAFCGLHRNEIVIASETLHHLVQDEAKQSPKDCHVATLLAMTTWIFQSKLFHALGNKSNLYRDYNIPGFLEEKTYADMQGGNNSTEFKFLMPPANTIVLRER